VGQAIRLPVDLFHIDGLWRQSCDRTILVKWIPN